jgi:hypothetical protein
MNYFVTVFYKFKTDIPAGFKELCWLAVRTASVSSMWFSTTYWTESSIPLLRIFNFAAVF